MSCPRGNAVSEWANYRACDKCGAMVSTYTGPRRTYPTTFDAGTWHTHRCVALPPVSDIVECLCGQMVSRWPDGTKTDWGKGTSHICWSQQAKSEPVDVDAVQAKIEEIKQKRAIPEVPGFDLQGLSRAVARCWYLREVERLQAIGDGQVTFADWYRYMRFVSRFGAEGLKRIAEMSKQHPRYDVDRTVKLLGEIRLKDIQPPSCEEIRMSQIGCQLTPEVCGARSNGHSIAANIGG
jgi:hypothetical protein